MVDVPFHGEARIWGPGHFHASYGRDPSSTKSAPCDSLFGVGPGLDVTRGFAWAALGAIRTPGATLAFAARAKCWPSK